MAEREPPELKSHELSRYARHLSLPEVGKEGQLRLKDSRVLVVGAGGLGSPLALYLAAAGIGTLGLVDFDEVDATNLQRQILHGTKDVGRSKLDSAVERLADVNPNVSVVTHDVRLDSTNALEILGAYDIVADGTEDAARRLERVLWNDPASGVMRHADAGYEDALDCAREKGLHLPGILDA